jgi:hypothetical protein
LDSGEITGDAARATPKESDCMTCVVCTV